LTIKSISNTKCPKCSNLRLSSAGFPSIPPVQGWSFGLRKP